MTLPSRVAAGRIPLRRSYQRILHDIPKCADIVSMRSIIAGDMLNFLSWAGETSIKASTLSMRYCDQAAAYMRSHLNQKVTVEQLAAFIGLSRSQLFRAFKKRSTANLPAKCWPLFARSRRSICC